MLLRSGDLIPVYSEAMSIPWTKRKALIFNHLFKGNVTFETFVFDTNVGDISPLSIYFNPCHWTVDQLNKFGTVMSVFDVSSFIHPKADSDISSSQQSETGSESSKEKLKSLLPKLIILPLNGEIVFNGTSLPVPLEYSCPPPSLSQTALLPTPMIPMNSQESFHSRIMVNKLDYSYFDNMLGHVAGLHTNESQLYQSEMPYTYDANGVLLANDFGQLSLTSTYTVYNFCHPLNGNSVYQTVFSNSNQSLGQTLPFLDDSNMLNNTNSSSLESSLEMCHKVNAYLPIGSQQQQIFDTIRDQNETHDSTTVN